MSTTSETSPEAARFDWLIWLVVAALAAGGIFGNWYYQTESLLLRVGVLVVMALIAFFIAIQTQRGRAAWTLMKDARTEIRRVVWPNRQETTQTTLVVLVLVAIFSFILWLLDSGLSWLVSSLIG